MGLFISAWKALEGENRVKREPVGPRQEQGWGIGKEEQGCNRICRPAPANQNVSWAQECHRWGLAGDYAVMPRGEGLWAWHHRTLRAEREWALRHRSGLRVLCLLHLLLLLLGEQHCALALRYGPSHPTPNPLIHRQEMFTSVYVCTSLPSYPPLSTPPPCTHSHPDPG